MKSISSDKVLQSYVIGVALGDGNLSNPNGRATRLRISCDKKHPRLVDKIARSLGRLLPNNKVNFVDHGNGCIDVSVYSNQLEKILCWKAKGGSKFVQKVSVPEWIKNNPSYAIPCLRGLIETDGAVYYDRKYPMMIFTSIIPNLTNDFYNMVVSLGFQPRLYEIEKPDKDNPQRKKLYHVRLSKKVSEFLSLVKPEKA